jgi:beta-galactosidase
MAQAMLTTILLDPNGREVGREQQASPVPAGATSRIDQTFSLPQAQLWSCDTPVLYHAVSEVRMKGNLIDSETTPFGIRSIEFTRDRGFLLNGQHVEIHGVCDHHDLGCLGSAVGNPEKHGLQRAADEP